MAVLFLVQTLVGAASQHYRAELAGFWGLNLARWMPFNLARTWHVQLAIFWVASSYLAAGIFLAPMIAGRKPRRQSWLAYGLLAALAIVVFGSLFGEFAGIHGWIRALWQWFGDQGLEYLDLGRFWQILLALGLCFWVVILYRGLSLALVLLAQFILGLELWRFHAERERLVLGAVLAPLTLCWIKMLARFRVKGGSAAGFGAGGVA